MSATNAKTKQGEQLDPEQKIETALDKTELFLEKYTKQLLIGLLVVVLIVGGYFAYQYLILQPRNEKAAAMMFVAEQQFAAENYEAALEGDGSNAGFLDVVSRYGSTRQGRLAAHYAGVCYMKQGDLDAAMTYLQKYKHVNGAPGVIINAQNLGLQGDIYVNRGDYAKAQEMYSRAVEAADNVLTTPYYLRKLAFKLQYAGSLEARDIDKLIGEFGQLK